MAFEKRRSGILLHPTSLPSRYGIGDFGENARMFIDKLEKSRQTLWQILPLCPIGSGNSPYQSTSAFAGNILLISLDDLVEYGFLKTEDLGEIPVFDTKRVDYEAVKNYKLPLLKLAYTRFQKTQSKAFASYCEKNAYWLEDYALFTALKAHFQKERKTNTKDFESFAKDTELFLTEAQQKMYFETACWNTFPILLRKRNAQSLKKWKKTLSDAIQEEMFYQYLFDMQWQALKTYANAKDVHIIGDAPIFVAYDSADVWANQNLFQLDSKGFPKSVAGVPPDYFSAEGQLWGNPLYDWNVHQKTDFAWWVNRIKKALQDTDYLRIDHFRGFESYWSVPFGAKNAIGGKWKKGPQMALFDALQKALGDLPLIAEDLGIITEEVHQLRQAVGLPGMCILQFAFGNDKNNAYLPHMCQKNRIMYSGTHDNDTSKGWYQKATEAEKDHYRRYMNVSGENVSWDFIRLAFASPAIFAIVPLQDVLRLDSAYRMNIPGVATGNWGFRFVWDMWQQSDIEGLRYLSELFGRYTKKDCLCDATKLC